MKGRDTREKLLEIVENMPQMNKAAFYSDPFVEPLVEELHSRWASNGYRGEPVDYATDEEAEKLLELAKRYASMPAWQAYRVFLERTEGRGGGGRD